MFQLPFANSLDWSRFSLHFYPDTDSPAEFLKVINTLRRVPLGRIQSLQAELADVRTR
jgi:hypothetical protein